MKKNEKPTPCAFLAYDTDENRPAVVYRPYGGPVPPEICHHFCKRILGCAGAGRFYPISTMDAYGDLWPQLEEAAAHVPRLTSATLVTYLQSVLDNLLNQYVERRTLPARKLYRQTEGHLLKAHAAPTPPAECDEGKDCGYAAAARSCAGEANAESVLSLDRLAERLPARPDAYERWLSAAFELEEIYRAIPDPLIVRVFRAYVRARGNLVEAAHLAHLSKTRVYKSWNRWLAVARRCALSMGLAE